MICVELTTLHTVRQPKWPAAGLVTGLQVTVQSHFVQPQVRRIKENDMI